MWQLLVYHFKVASKDLPIYWRMNNFVIKYAIYYAAQYYENDDWIIIDSWFNKKKLDRK